MPDNSLSFEEILNMNFASSKQKIQKNYGLKLAKSMWTNISVGYNNYYQNRLTQWKTAREFAKGISNHNEFKNLLNIEGAKAWVNMDWTLLKILPRYKQSLLGRWMDRDEEITVKATDIMSSIYREREKILAKYRMENKEQIAQMEQMAGTKLEDGFTPQDQDELEIWHKRKNRLPEEAFFEKTINQIIENSYKDALKRELLSDGIEVNVLVTKLERVVSHSKSFANRLKIRRCKPERTVYNIFESSIGEDVSIVGEAYPMKITDIRREFPDLDEKKLFELAKKSQKGLNQAEPLSWNDSYVYSFTRPYDDYSIMVFDFEVKSVDKDYYVKTKNQYDKDIIVPKKSKPNPRGDQEMKGEVIENERYNIYCGIWAVDTDIMLQWDIAPNMIRPYQNGVDCFFNYSIVIPDNDGTLVPSLIDRAIPCVRQMILTGLKIQQMKSMMEPDNEQIDLDSWQGLDLGTGNTLQPLQLLKLKQQTGKTFFDSSDEQGNAGQKRPPVSNGALSGNVAQINVLINDYNFWLQRLNDEIGENADSLGSVVAAKRGAAVNQNQIQAANNATEYIYQHYLQLMELNATKIGYILWDMIIAESGDYKQMLGMNNDMIDTTFDINVRMSSKSERKNKLSEYVSLAVQEKTIPLSQAYVLNDMENPKDAIMYLEFSEKKSAEMAAQSSQQQMQMNAQIQQQSLMSKAQADSMVLDAKYKGEEKLEKARADKDAYKELVKLVSDATLKSIEMNVPLPQEVSQLFNSLKENIITQSIIKPEQKEQQELAAQQQAAEQEAAQQEQM